MDAQERKLLRIQAPGERISISRVFDKKYSIKKLEQASENQTEAKKNKIKPPAKQSPRPENSGEILELPVDFNLLSQSMVESQEKKDAGDGTPDEAGPHSELLQKNDYLKQKMYCRLMHTKRDNLWNELHKLDRKRIKLLMNRFVIQKDHEAMQYIIRNQKRELVEKHCQQRQLMAKVEQIKQSKSRQRAEALVRLRKIERQNFESVLNYLRDTVPEAELRAMLSQARKRVPESEQNTRTSKRRKAGSAAMAKQPKLQIGKQMLYNRLAEINSDLYRQVYAETQKKFQSAQPSESKTGVSGMQRQKRRPGPGKGALLQKNVDFGQDFNQLYIRESMKVN